MGAIRTIERVEKAQGVQFVKGDKEVEQLFRGWLGIPVTESLDDLPEGCWIVRLEGNPQVFFVHDEAFKADFREVIGE